MELKDSVSEQNQPQDILSEIIADTPAAPARKIRPELVMVIIALLCAILLAATVMVCMPYINAPEPVPPTTAPTEAPAMDEDPEAYLHQDAPAEPLPSIEPIIEPEANPYGRLDFQYNRNNYLYCLRQESYPGVDVSAFQGNIDWQKVKDSGIRFAMLRLGYRGYESGKLVEDEYIQQNLEQTKAVGMPIGAYFSPRL